MAATLLLSGAPGAENNGDRPKQNIPDRIELGVVHPFLRAVMVILDDADPSTPHLTLTEKINSKKIG